jgi:outer membrane protein assembly factor BamA
MFRSVRSVRSSLVLVSTLAFMVSIARPLFAAQCEPDDEEKPAAEAAPPLHVGTTDVDVSDLWRKLRHHDNSDDAAAGKRFLVVAPTIGSKPSTGLTAGVNSNMAFFGGDPASTHISTLSGGFRVSQKQQVLSGVRFSVFTANDRWFVQGDNRFSWTSQNIYGLGVDTLPSDAENVKYNFFRVSETTYRRVGRGLFIGGGLTVNTHEDVRPGDGAAAGWDQSAYLAYTRAHGFAEDGQTSSGANFGLLYDTRDNAINAYRGWYASASYRTFFNGFVGGNSTWQELSLDARTYLRLSHDGRHRLAFWAMSDLVTGGTAPYFDLPSIASDGRSARGYGDGRYRGEHLVYGEVEYRGSLMASGLLGVVVFANTTTLDNAETGQKLFESWAPGAGFGFRVLLNKRSRTNLATDYGWGKDGSRGFYLGIQEAF